MTESATAANRRRTATRITDCAKALTEERGIDGFTMDDIAACAGVSRRTLFNYVPGKLDAVLGGPVEADPANLAAFRSGGPTGELVADLRSTIAVVLDSKDTPAEELERVRRLIADEPRLHKAMHDRFARLSSFLAKAILDREGPGFDPLRAKAAATVTLSLFDVALDAFVADPTDSLAQHYLRAFDATAVLFG